MNIIHTEASCGWGGQEIRILEEARGLIERGHEVRIVCPPESHIFVEGPKRGVPTHALPIGSKNLKGLFALRRWLKQNPPDVINTHSSTDTWLAALACKTLRNPPPIVRTRHISSPIPNNWASRWLYAKAVSHVVTTGEALRRQVVEQTGADPERVTSIPTGIDPERFKPSDKREARIKLGLDPESNYIGIVATLRSWKGHQYLLEAFAQLNLHGWKLLIVGDGPQRENIEKTVQEQDLTDRVILAGQQKSPETWLQAMDIFCLPSYANEGVPQAILQAMFTGLPIVTTTAGAIMEAVSDDGTQGIIVPTKDSIALRKAIDHLAAHPEIYTHIEKTNRSLATLKFSKSLMLTEMEKIFQTSSRKQSHQQKEDNIKFFSIIIPNYKTKELIEHCITALKEQSFLHNQLVVIDNNSNDESIEYLRGLSDITLIENKDARPGGEGHKAALDIGVMAAESSWVILFHSDTIVLYPGWDLTLRSIITENPGIVGFSSTARDINPFDSAVEKAKRNIREKEEDFVVRLSQTNKKIMSYCFGIKKDFLLQENYIFSRCNGDVATDLYNNNIRGKHPFALLGRRLLSKLLWHTSNTTSILTGQISDSRTVARNKQKYKQLETHTKQPRTSNKYNP